MVFEAFDIGTVNEFINHYQGAENSAMVSEEDLKRNLALFKAQLKA